MVFQAGVILVSYLVLGRLAFFIAGTFVGILLHSSWETQKDRNSTRSVLGWEERVDKEKGEGDTKVIYLSIVCKGTYSPSIGCPDRLHNSSWYGEGY